MTCCVLLARKLCSASSVYLRTHCNGQVDRYKARTTTHIEGLSVSVSYSRTLEKRSHIGRAGSSIDVIVLPKITQNYCNYRYGNYVGNAPVDKVIILKS